MLTLTHLTHCYVQGDHDYMSPPRITRSALRHVYAPSDSDHDGEHATRARLKASHVAGIRFMHEDAARRGLSLRTPAGQRNKDRIAAAIAFLASFDQAA